MAFGYSKWKIGGTQIYKSAIGGAKEEIDFARFPSDMCGEV